MSAIQEASSERPIDRWFASYSNDHRNDTNQWIHVFAVPLILWSVIALLWCIPVPAGSGFRAGLWAGLACFAAWMFYFRNSRAIGFGMLAVFVAMLWLTFWIERSADTRFLLWLAIGVRSEEHTSELQSPDTISYAVFCLKKKCEIGRASCRERVSDTV